MLYITGINVRVSDLAYYFLPSQNTQRTTLSILILSHKITKCISIILRAFVLKCRRRVLQKLWIWAKWIPEDGKGRMEITFPDKSHSPQIPNTLTMSHTGLQHSRFFSHNFYRSFKPLWFVSADASIRYHSSVRYARQGYTPKHEKLGFCLSLTVNSTIRVYLVAETNAATARKWKATQCPFSGGSSALCSWPCASTIYMQVPQSDQLWWAAVT